jgi:hypothetical protein
LHLVPVGIHYEDKAGIRSRAYVHVGDVMDLDAELASMGIAPVADAEDHEAVHHLTTEIEARLRRSAPDYSSDQEARRLAFASEVALRVPGRFRVSYADRQRVAARLAHADFDGQSAVAATADRYRSELDEASLSDGDLMLTQGPSGLGGRLPLLATVLVLLAPLVLAGIVLNVVPAIALLAVAKYRHREMTPATVRLLSAIVLFLVTWITWATLAWAQWDWRAGLIVFIACPLYGAVAVGALDRAADLRRMWSGRKRIRGLSSGIDQLLTERRRLVAAVEGALGS